MKIKTWHVLILLSCAVLVAYYPVLSAPLNSVDDVRLANQLLNRTDFSWQDFLVPGAGSYYRPLVNSSFIFDRLLWGMEAPLLHLENVFLHLLNTLLVFSVARYFSRTLTLPRLGMPIAAALLFGLHPINVEAVAWIAGRADLLAGSFVLLTLYFFCRYLTAGKLLWLIPASFSFLLGCLAKETALFVLPGLFLLAWVRCRPPYSKPISILRSSLKSIIPLIPFTAVCSGYFLLRFWALHGRDLGLQHVARVSAAFGSASAPSTVAVSAAPEPFLLKPLFLTVESLVKISGFYMKKLFWPFPLNFGIIDVPDGYLWAGIALLLLAFFLLRRLTIAGSLALTSMSLGSIALLVSLGGISWTPIAERYMYVPAAFFSLSCMSAVTANVSFRENRLLSWFVAVLLILFFVGTFQRSLVWQDNSALFSDTVEKSPDFVGAKNELAMALLAKGQKQAAYDILRDIDLPDFQVASLNRIMVLSAEGRLEEARSLLVERLQNPGSYKTTIQIKLVSVLEKMINQAPDTEGMRVYREEALYYLGEIWERTRNPFYLYRMGQFQMVLGEHDKARASFAKASELFPEDSPYKAPARKLAQANK